MDLVQVIVLSLIGLGVMLGLTVFLAMCFRTIVPADQVHVVQSRAGETVYGDKAKGATQVNAYYKWPSWIPVIGIKVTVLSSANIALDIKDYLAFDSGKLPFLVDLKAFFQIDDFKLAARRIASEESLRNQLIGIMSGACRSVLAQHDIEKIMSDRATFGDNFTREIEGELKEWGVRPIKNIELMNIEDSPDSDIIETIQKKKESEIRKQSEEIVAENDRLATEAKLLAKQKMDITAQEVNRLTALNDIKAKLETEQATADLNQKTAELNRITTQKQLEVHQFEQIKLAETAKQKLEIEAEAKKQADIVKQQGLFEAEKLQAETIKVKAQADFESDKLKAQALEVKAKADSEAAKLYAAGVQAQGLADAESKKALELATVAAQVELQTKIGSDKAYQDHLANMAKIDAEKAIGIEKAKLMAKAEIKVIANASSVDSGIKSASDILSSNGGMQVGAFFEGLKTSDVGRQILALLPQLPSEAK